MELLYPAFKMQTPNQMSYWKELALNMEMEGSPEKCLYGPLSYTVKLKKYLWDLILFSSLLVYRVGGALFFFLSIKSVAASS